MREVWVEWGDERNSRERLREIEQHKNISNDDQSSVCMSLKYFIDYATPLAVYQKIRTTERAKEIPSFFSSLSPSLPRPHI